MFLPGYLKAQASSGRGPHGLTAPLRQGPEGGGGGVPSFRLRFGASRLGVWGLGRLGFRVWAFGVGRWGLADFPVYGL